MLPSQYKNIRSTIRKNTAIKSGNLLSLRNIIIKNVENKTNLQFSLKEKDNFELSFSDNDVFEVLFAEKSNSHFTFELHHCGLFGFGFIYANKKKRFIPFGYQVMNDLNNVVLKIHFSYLTEASYYNDYLSDFSNLVYAFKIDNKVNLKYFFDVFYQKDKSVCLLDLIQQVKNEAQDKIDEIQFSQDVKKVVAIKELLTKARYLLEKNDLKLDSVLNAKRILKSKKLDLHSKLKPLEKIEDFFQEAVEELQDKKKEYYLIQADPNAKTITKEMLYYSQFFK